MLLLGMFQLQSLEAGRLVENPPKVAVEALFNFNPTYWKRVWS